MNRLEKFWWAAFVAAAPLLGWLLGELASWVIVGRCHVFCGA